MTELQKAAKEALEELNGKLECRLTADMTYGKRKGMVLRCVLGDNGYTFLGEDRKPLVTYKDTQYSLVSYTLSVIEQYDWPIDVYYNDMEITIDNLEQFRESLT